MRSNKLVKSITWHKTTITKLIDTVLSCENDVQRKIAFKLLNRYLNMYFTNSAANDVYNMVYISSISVQHILKLIKTINK